MTPKYPNVEVELTNQDGNAFAILARVRRALRKNKVLPREIKQFVKEATAGDYDNLLQTIFQWVNVN